MSRILFIEDDLTFAGLFESILKIKLPNADLQVDHCRTLEEGMTRAEGAHVILLDLTLSMVWNAETTPTQIPTLRKFAPVIVVTGKKTDEEYFTAKWVSELISVYGADDFIPKDDPNVIVRIFCAINAAVGRRIYESQNKALTKPLGTSN